MDYTTLTEADRLLIARDRLRGLETDHYRTSLDAQVGPVNNPAANGAEQRVAQLEEQIAVVKDEIAKLEKSVDKE